MDSCVSWMGSELVLGALAGGGLFVGCFFVVFSLCCAVLISCLVFVLVCGRVVLSWSGVCSLFGSDLALVSSRLVLL